MANNEGTLVLRPDTDLSGVEKLNHFGESRDITLWVRVKILRAYSGFSEVFLKERSSCLQRYNNFQRLLSEKLFQYRMK